MKTHQALLKGNIYDLALEIDQNLSHRGIMQKFKAEYYADSKRILLFIYEKYFYRINSDASATLLYIEQENHQVLVQIITSGTGAGVFSLSYSADTVYIDEIISCLEPHLAYPMN